MHTRPCLALDNGGQSPLWAASEGGHVEAIKFLLDIGGELHKVDNHGSTPLWAASREGHAGALQIFLL